MDAFSGEGLGSSCQTSGIQFSSSDSMPGY